MKSAKGRRQQTQRNETCESMKMTVQTTITPKNDICVLSSKDEEVTPVIVSSETAEETVQQDEMSWLAPWYLCANCFLLNFISWGFVSSFGMTIDHSISPITANIMNQGEFQSYYEDRFLALTPSQISWIGSIQAFLLFALGVITGPIYDYGYLRSLVSVGCFLCVLGTFLLSISTQYWQLIVCQGIMFGLGCSCLFLPGLAVLSSYFSKRRAFALGLSGCGSPIGQLTWGALRI